MTGFDYQKDMFDKYVERKTRCRAIVVTEENIWDIAQWLSYRGYLPRIGWTKDGLFLEAQREDVSFTASVERRDALIMTGYDDIEFVPGLEFRRAWEEEESK